MKTDDLIQVLVADARPVQRLWGARWLLWLVFSFLFVALGAVIFGLRADLSQKVQEATFLLEGGVLFILFVLSAKSVFQLSVPGETCPISTFSLPVLSFSLWFVLLTVRFWVEGTMTVQKSGFMCIWRILALGAIPAVVCFVLLRGAAPYQRSCVGFFAALSAFSVAALGTQSVCAIDTSLHIFVWHFIPVFLIAFLSASAGRSVFRKGQNDTPKSFGYSTR